MTVFVVCGNGDFSWQSRRLAYWLVLTQPISAGHSATRNHPSPATTKLSFPSSNWIMKPLAYLNKLTGMQSGRSSSPSLAIISPRRVTCASLRKHYEAYRPGRRGFLWRATQPLFVSGGLLTKMGAVAWLSQTRAIAVRALGLKTPRDAVQQQ